MNPTDPPIASGTDVAGDAAAPGPTYAEVRDRLSAPLADMMGDVVHVDRFGNRPWAGQRLDDSAPDIG